LGGNAVKDLTAQLKKYVAYTSVGASTVRGQRTPGLVSKLRELLMEEVDLCEFGRVSAHGFGPMLDAATEAIRSRMPPGTRHWGIARKVLNIFLRGAFYNIYLREAFGLAGLERLLELPLDSLTVVGMKKRSPARSLPRWRGVKHLTPEHSASFQERALAIAESESTSRASRHLPLAGSRVAVGYVQEANCAHSRPRSRGPRKKGFSPEDPWP
jgi:hypothetical protein